jgi:hypothetical protein
MTEKQYQLEKSYDKYPDIPKRTVKKIFDKSWSSCNRLGDALNIMSLAIGVYKDTKNGILK